MSIREGTLRRLERILLLVFATVWLCAYVLVAMEWPRYAIATVVISSLFTAKLMVDLVSRVTPWIEMREAHSLREYAGVLAADPLGTSFLS